MQYANYQPTPVYSSNYTKPRISSKIANCRLISRRPGHSIRWTAPSQQQHCEVANSVASIPGNTTTTVGDS